jgi:hypothetical protein
MRQLAQSLKYNRRYSFWTSSQSPKPIKVAQLSIETIIFCARQWIDRGTKAENVFSSTRLTAL